VIPKKTIRKRRLDLALGKLMKRYGAGQVQHAVLRLTYSITYAKLRRITRGKDG